MLQYLKWTLAVSACQDPFSPITVPAQTPGCLWLMVHPQLGSWLTALSYCFIFFLIKKIFIFGFELHLLNILLTYYLSLLYAWGRGGRQQTKLTPPSCLAYIFSQRPHDTCSQVTWFIHFSKWMLAPTVCFFLDTQEDTKQSKTHPCSQRACSLVGRTRCTWKTVSAV